MNAFGSDYGCANVVLSLVKSSGDNNTENQKTNQLNKFCDLQSGCNQGTENVVEHQ